MRSAPTLFALLAVGAPAAAATPPAFAPAVAAAERGEFGECARAFGSIAAAASQHGLARRARYGEAVCAASAGDIDRGFAALEAATALDFHDLDRFYDDPRLQPLRADARWPALERLFHEAVDRWRAGLQADLHELYLEDRRDRSGGAGEFDWSEVAVRDRRRVARVREILAAESALGADDLLHAATVLQHGEEIADFELAHELALRAAELDADLPQARRLAAEALDRALVAAGEPQRYGTQSILVDGRWQLAPVDPTVTDEERLRWDVPPLAVSRARVAAMPPSELGAEQDGSGDRR